MIWRSLCMAMGLLLSQSALADSGQSKAIDPALKLKLNKLRSQALQRQDREPAIIDLSRSQRERRAGQALNTLKTKDPGNRHLPLLKRK